MLFWSDLKGNGGNISPREDWVIKNLTVRHGVTKVVVTVVNEKGLRLILVIGLQYYPKEPKEVIIFDRTLKRGSLSGINISDKVYLFGKELLVIYGNGQRQRVAINDIELDISDFDSKSSYLKILYDQGADKTIPRLFIPGIGDLYLHIDDKQGYEKIIVPFDRFKYVTNTLNRLIIRGKWDQKTKIFIKSIKLICNGT